MAVVGIDFGTLHSKIGVARHRGIDIIVNEVSNRATPSLVAFGPKQRFIGEPAKTQETSNFKNTVGSLKRLIGRTLEDSQVQEREKKFINAKLVDVNGTVGAEVTYRGEQATFSWTQITASYLGKLRDIASNELKTAVNDIVISVPGWFTDIQRRAIIDAAAIANLNVLRLINDTTATALGYGITKADLPEPENPRHVVFVDVGHADMSVSVVAFSKGQLVVKSTAYEPNLGGRDIDYALLEHFSHQFETKYKIDVLSNPKATFRLVAGCEKLKKVLSANNEAPLNVESIMNDVDASSKLTREELEQLIQPVLDAIPAPLERALRDSGLTLEQIDAIELIGGTTRVPAVRQRIQAVFPGKTLSFTLNQDEAIARGATFSCAMLSPVFKVRDFHITDVNHYPIKTHWFASPADPDDDTELLVFPQGNSVPSTKVLSFYRKEPFSIDASYSEPSLLPGTFDPLISSFAVRDVPLPANGDSACIKVRTKLTIHGTTSFESAYVEETEEKEELLGPMDVDATAEGAASSAPPPPPPKKKRTVKKREIAFEAKYKALDKAVVEGCREREIQMHAADKLVMDTEDRKNALEEYVYDMRGKLEDRYAVYVQSEEKDVLLKGLQEAEDWLYTEEGEEATKSAYVSRLDALKKFGDPISFRFKEVEERRKAISNLRETLDNYMAQATSTNDEKYSHIDDREKQSVVEKVATIRKWLEDQNVRQSERPKNVDPVLTSAEIEKKRDELIYFAIPILTKPKPKPLVTPSGSGAQTPKEGAKEEQQQQQQQPTNKEGASPQPPPAAKDDVDKGSPEMDVDID